MYLIEDDISWSDEINLIKNSNNLKLSMSELLNIFKSLRLVNLSIKEIDSNFICFNSLVELNLTGNLLNAIENIPSGVEILDLNANM